MFWRVEKAVPLYAYRCTQCGHRFEKIQNFSANPELVCPKCNGVLERPLTAPRLHFKGAGWYVNDYAAKSSEPASESAPSDAKAPASSETKTPSAASDSSSTSSTTPTSAPAPASSSAPPKTDS